MQVWDVLFASPSVKEGVELAAMETPAAGVPPVVRDLPVLREVFDSAARFATTHQDLAAGLGAAVTDDMLARQAWGPADSPLLGGAEARSATYPPHRWSGRWTASYLGPDAAAPDPAIHFFGC